MASRETTTNSRYRRKIRAAQAAGDQAVREDVVADLSELARAPLDPPDTDVEDPNYLQLSAVLFGLALVVFGLTIWILFDVWVLLAVVLVGAAFVTFGLINFS